MAAARAGAPRWGLNVLFRNVRWRGSQTRAVRQVVEASRRRGSLPKEARVPDGFVEYARCAEQIVRCFLFSRTAVQAWGLS